MIVHIIWRTTLLMLVLHAQKCPYGPRLAIYLGACLRDATRRRFEYIACSTTDNRVVHSKVGSTSDTEDVLREIKKTTGLVIRRRRGWLCREIVFLCCPYSNIAFPIASKYWSARLAAHAKNRHVPDEAASSGTENKMQFWPWLCQNQQHSLALCTLALCTPARHRQCSQPQGCCQT